MTKNQVEYLNYLEKVRSNTATEGLRLKEIQETVRANKAREAETHRSNVAAEKENIRYHSASVAETKRANVAKEDETKRHNYSQEAYNATQVLELNRHNLADEGLRIRSQQEVERSNRVYESVGLISAKASASQASAAIMRASEDRRHNIAVETETNRHNEQVEFNDLWGKYSSYVNDKHKNQIQLLNVDLDYDAAMYKAGSGWLSSLGSVWRAVK